jgi:hypothetical protein
MRTIIFTLNNNTTRNARAVCQNLSGKRYDTPSSFIELLIRNNIIRKDNEVVVYEVGEFVQEYGAIPDDTPTGYISVK